MEQETLDLDIDTITLQAVAYRDRQKPARGIVIFLHGQGLIPDLCEPAPEMFTEEGLLFTTFYQRGTNGTPGEYTYKGTAADGYEIARRVLLRYGESPATPLFVITHSSAVCGVFQNHFEGRASPSALACVCPVIKPSYFQHNMSYRHKKTGASGYERWMSQLRGSPHVLETLREFFSDPAWIWHPERLEARYKGVFKGVSAQWGYLSSDDWEKLIHNWYTMLSLTDEAPWRTVSFPVATYLAEQDEWVAAAEAEALHRQLPHPLNELRRFAGADHLMKGHWPEIWKSAALFFARVASATSSVEGS